MWGLAAIFIGLNEPALLPLNWGSVLWLLLAGGVLSQVAGTVAQGRESERLSAERHRADQLQEQVDQIASEYKREILRELYVFAHDVLGLDDSDRVSVYAHEGQHFTMLGRYSENPEFMKPGRTIYPQDQGCVGEAWRNKTSSCTLPSFENSQEAYEEQLQTRWNVPPDIVRRFRMKSRTVAAFALEDYRNEINERFAVLVVESTREGAFDLRTLEQAVYPPTQDRINDVTRFLVTRRPFQPSAAMAKRAGF
jgi:hypothetical protein